jgi:transcriptional regulator with PAS, ATPase and Fis domain
LRAIQEKEIRRVGGKQVIAVDFRLVSAANQSIERLVDQKKFKQDLFFRINVVQLSLPPLRDRLEDIPELVTTFLQGKILEPALLHLLQQYSWPGNIRELKNLIAACVALSGDKKTISVTDLPETTMRRICSTQQVRSEHLNLAEEYRVVLEESEREMLRRAYHTMQGNVSELARSLQIDRSHLHKKLVKYRIHQPKSS